MTADQLAEALGRLRRCWYAWNAAYFGWSMRLPDILIEAPSNPKDLGGYTWESGVSCIRINPDILTGRHHVVRPGAEYADGRSLLADDTLLHEMVHQFQVEVTGQHEPGDHGHGPAFRDECNRIGAKLGLPPVKSRWHRVGCHRWPDIVRPAGYYHGACIEQSPSAADWLNESIADRREQLGRHFKRWHLAFLIELDAGADEGAAFITADEAMAKMGR